MNRPCIALAILSCSLAGSLFAVNPAKCQSGYKFVTTRTAYSFCPIRDFESDHCYFGYRPRGFDVLGEQDFPPRTSPSITDGDHDSVASTDATGDAISYYRSMHDPEYDREVYGIIASDDPLLYEAGILDPVNDVVVREGQEPVELGGVLTEDAGGSLDQESVPGTRADGAGKWRLLTGLDALAGVDAVEYYEYWRGLLSHWQSEVNSAVELAREVDAGCRTTEEDTHGEYAYGPEERPVKWGPTWYEGETWHESETWRGSATPCNDLPARAAKVDARGLLTQVRDGARGTLTTWTSNNPTQLGPWVVRLLAETADRYPESLDRVSSLARMDSPRPPRGVLFDEFKCWYDVCPVTVCPVTPPAPVEVTQREEGGRELLLLVAEAMERAAGTLHVASEGLARFAR